jgi:hypothetical protein
MEKRQQRVGGSVNEGELRKREFENPWKNSDVFIKAESDPHVKTPSAKVVLTTTRPGVAGRARRNLSRALRHCRYIPG